MAAATPVLPLREPPEDIPLLAKHFLEEACAALGRPVPKCSCSLLNRLKGYPFLGNVRELKAWGMTP